MTARRLSELGQPVSHRHRSAEKRCRVGSPERLQSLLHRRGRRFRKNARIEALWSGRRTALTLGADLRPRPGLSIAADWERNDVALAGGSFTTDLVRLGPGWQFSPRASLTGSVQYGDISDIVGIFTRFRWIVRPGSDLYVVYTHNLRRGEPLDPRGLYTLERRAATKLTYTHRF